MHWADGGETDVENSLLLCSKHHRLQHEGGYTIETDYMGRFYFRSSQGKAIPDVHGRYPSRDGFDHVEGVSEPQVDYSLFNRAPRGEDLFPCATPHLYDSLKAEGRVVRQFYG